MAEKEVPQAQGPEFGIQRIYIKDSSFESPESPEIFTKEWQPEIEIDMNTRSRSLGEDVYEVVLRVTVTAKLEDKTAFLAEIEQAGIFLISGLEDAETHQTLGAFCPNLLYPYVRENIDSVITRASFPALMLAPVNFDALYAQKMEEDQAQNQH